MMRLNFISWKCIVFGFTLFIVLSGSPVKNNERQVISLNGTWLLAKTNSPGKLPLVFGSKAPVPGLIDMAFPKIDAQDTGYFNAVYWYKRNFRLTDTHADVIQLKINKAKYHTWVYINGKLAGENVYSFTPSQFDIKPFLHNNNAENELIIAVGCRNNLPDTVTHGGDFEKTKYIPGIYDDVQLIVSNHPFISNVQTVPDVKNKQLRVVASLFTGNSELRPELAYVVREAASKKVLAQGKIKANDGNKADFIVSMEGCKLWSPENPFLYDLELKTSSDNKRVRFGMRSFESIPDSGIFLLNGKPYYMRGTNVCIFRFFEDPDRKGLPWDSKWITKLHSRFREMHWNSIRYCIGFPPERWYEIADSLGFLIQDEYPLWTGGKGGFEKLLKGISSKQLAAEYQAWMKERWNHPCVVVWDAQNESVNDTTSKAIQLVRSLDLSNRPWDNGWAAPASKSDAIEAHPYLFSRYMKKVPGPEGYLKELLNKPLIPGNDPNDHSPLPSGGKYLNPIILNEYGWIWLNRNGSPTTLTDKVYENVFPEANTAEKRLEVYAKNLGILTEYWRAHRKAAAVMHFCGLGYSRPEKPRGQTSDNFTDINNLTYEPQFYKYVKPAFSPVGIMVEFWDNKVQALQAYKIPVHMINDTDEPVKGVLKLSFIMNGKVVSSQSMPYVLEGLGKEILEIPVTFPATKGACSLVAEIVYKKDVVKSTREFNIN